MKIHYNKLVRDLIPEIIEASGKSLQRRVLSDDEYYKELYKKLGEEVQEFIEADIVEELADILEIVDAILDIKGVSWEELRAVQKEKREKRGGFKERIFLEWVEEEDI